MVRTAGTALLCAAVLVTPACANTTAERDAADTSARFLTAIGAGDAATACSLLTPRVRDEMAVSEGAPCEQSLPAARLAGGSVTAVDVWADWAKASTSTGALFLTEFNSEWLIAAAGCQPHGNELYSCVVGG